jgi:hypothetical protein
MPANRCRRQGNDLPGPHGRDHVELGGQRPGTLSTSCRRDPAGRGVGPDQGATNSRWQLKSPIVGVAAGGRPDKDACRVDRQLILLASGPERRRRIILVPCVHW